MGSRAYTLAAELDYEPGDVILEVGAERGEGSTEFLAGLGVTLVTIDVDPQRLSALPHRANVLKIRGQAEFELRDWKAMVGEPIRFAWLDGHDWPYDGIPMDEATAYERLYRSRGQVFSRAASALSHLRIVQAIAEFVPAGGRIAIDDTWYRWPEGADIQCWGKGGTAVPWLLDHGFDGPLVLTEHPDCVVVIKR
jgi:hypothetical protein